MERGKYIRAQKAGTSGIQKKIVDYLNNCTEFPRFRTIVEIQKALDIPDSWSTKTSLNRSLARLRLRGLIRSLGRNENNQHLWIAAEMRPINSETIGDHMTMKDWLQCVADGGFIDYDGNDYYATETEESEIVVIPSDVKKGKIDKRWTHIVWCNR